MRGALPARPPRLLALDLDGTLLRPERPLRPAVVAAVRAAAAAGVRATIVTGRMVASVAPYARELGIGGSLICYQGAVIADAATGRFEREIPVPNEVALEVYAFARGTYHVQFYAGDRFFVEDDNAYAELYARVAGLRPVVVPSLADAFADRDSTKVNLIMDPERTAECANRLQALLRGRAYVTRSNPEFVEVMHPRVDKGEALRVVAASYGIAAGEVLAIGDSFNDVPLLRAAGFGVAMGTAPEALRTVADAIVGGVDGDGVAEAIERFVLPAARRAAS